MLENRDLWDPSEAGELYGAKGHKTHGGRSVLYRSEGSFTLSLVVRGMVEFWNTVGLVKIMRNAVEKQLTVANRWLPESM